MRSTQLWSLAPCLSGNKPYRERIIKQKSWIKRLVVGISKLEDFVKDNDRRNKLEGEGLEFVVCQGLEDKILEVAKEGHNKPVETSAA